MATCEGVLVISVLDEENVTVLLRGLVLEQGTHIRREDGLSLMEAVAWISGLSHSAEPVCVDPVFIRVCSFLNNRWDDRDRQKLLRLVLLLVGTRQGGQLSKRRAFFIIDRVIRLVFSAFLRALPCKPRPDFADRLEKMAVFDQESAKRCLDECLAVWADINEAIVLPNALSNAVDAVKKARDGGVNDGCVLGKIFDTVTVVSAYDL
jgi:hypothetical protein